MTTLTMSLVSPSGLLAAACLLAALGLFHYMRSPLRKAPGPKLAVFTSMVLKWHELRAARTSYIHQLHQRYGPVVRIAPNELSFTSWPAIKEIYCSQGSGYDKTDFYSLFQIFQRRPMFALLHKADHARRKRIIADRYANTTIMHSHFIKAIEERSCNFVRHCSTLSLQGHSVDVFQALHAYACDCITHHLFHPRGTNCLEDEQDTAILLQIVADDSLQNRLISLYYPHIHKLFTRLSIFGKPRDVSLADNYVRWAVQCSDVAPFTLMSRLRKETQELDELDMAAECLDHMVAGIDTTGDTLCFLMWELSQPRSMQYQRTLSEELRHNPTSPVDQLSFLDAVVNEALRCFPAIPMSLPRVVPQGGRIIDGLRVPQQTVVSSQPFSVHNMNQDIFPEPTSFNPHRWLVDHGDVERRRHLFAFSTGGRGCIGRHLAMMEMKILLREVYRDFSTYPDPSMTQESMATSDQLISTRPRDHRCLLNFHALADV